MAKEKPEDLESVRFMDNSITSSGDQSGCVTITAKESENIGVELLDDLDSYMQDINDRLTISRMVSDSVIRGMVGAVEQEAADRISQKESEIARLKEKLLYHNNVFAAENGVLECPMHTSMEGSASSRSNLFPPVKSPEHDRIRDFLTGYKTEVWKQLTEIKDRIHTFRQRNSIDSSNSGLKLAMSFGSASTTPLEKVPERFSDIEGAVDCLQITLNSLFNHFSDMVHLSGSLFFEWQQEREFQAEVEATTIAVYFRGLQEEFEGMLWDENSKVGVGGSVNFLKKMKEELSTLHQELDGLNRLLSVPEAGHIASLGSMGNGEEYGNGGSSKVTDHLHRKLLGSHVFSPSSPWETSGKDEESTIAMLENIDNAKLVHMTKEDLVDHFKTEMIKMKRYHESKVQEMTEEYFRLKREYLRERGSSLPLKKDKDFDELKRKIPEVVLKLDEVLVESERFLSLNGDVERLSKMKERLDVLSENSHLKNMLAEKKREIEHLCSEVYDAREKISCYSQSEANLLVVIENLKREKEEKRIKSTICGEVYQCFLTVLPTHVHCITDNLCMESDPRKASCEVSCREAVSDGRDSRDSEIENLYMDSVISQELSELVFSKALREAEEKFDYLSNECLNEKFLRVYLEQEVLERAEFLKFEAAEKQKLKEEILQLAASLEEKGRLAKETGDQLAKEKKLFDQATQELERLRDETWQQGMLIAEINKETEELKSDLDRALEKIEIYKEDSCKLNQKLDFVMAELNQKEKEIKLLLLAVQERQDKLSLAEASEKLYKKQMESITEVAHGVMKSLADFESRAAVDLERNLSRLGVLGSEMKSLTQDAKILKRWGLTYKKRLEKKCQEFEKAEKEVDLLGDKVDYLSDLLEKIYIALDHYSPILKHYPGVMETLELVKGELSGGSVKSV